MKKSSFLTYSLWKETTSLFLCHNLDQTELKETRIFDQLYTRLEVEGAGSIDYHQGSPTEDGFQTFLRQQLPLCQRFILFQTPALVSLPEVRQAVNTVLQLVEQQKMEGIVRIIAVPSLPHWYLMTLIDHRHLHHAGPGWAKHYAPGIRISSMSAKS